GATRRILGLRKECRLARGCGQPRPNTRALGEDKIWPPRRKIRNVTHLTELPEPIGIGGGYRTISVGWPVERRYHPSPLVDLRVPIAKPEPAAISMRDPRPINDLGLGNRHAQRAVVDAVGTFIHYHEDLARAGLAEVGRPPEGRPDLAGGIAVLGSIQPGPHRR